MKYAKKFLASMLSVLLLAGSLSTPAAFSSSAAGGLPANVIVGYWHNFDNGSTKTQLGDVHPEWDVLNVSFMETQGDRCTAKFAPDTDVYPQNGEEMMKEDIKELQAKGKKVVISLGGQNGSILLNSAEQRDTFLKTSMAVIDEYGFDGFDVDLEGSSITITGSDSLEKLSTPIQVNLNYILHQYVATYGSDFIITMAPEHPYVQGGSIAWGSPWGAYLPLLNNCRDILSWIHPQYYNNGIDYEGVSGFSAASLIKCSEMLIEGFDVATGERFEGLKPSQVAFGVPASQSAAGSGQLSISAYKEALTTLLQKYPDYRGVMTWSTNWDEKQNNNGFVLGMRSVINQYGDVTFGFGSVTADKKTVNAGDAVTFKASVKNPEGSVQYKFDLYKDGKLISAGSYGSSDKFVYTTADAGEYYVSVTAKDSKGTEVSGKSDVVKAVIGELIITETSCNASGIVETGKKITFNAKSTGGLAPVEYNFVIYNGSEIAAQSGYKAQQSFEFTPSKGGEYQGVVTVKDSKGNTNSKTFAKFFVKQALSAEDITVTKSGSSTTYTIKTSGGTGGTGGNRYSFYVYSGGVVYAKQVRGSSISFTASSAPAGAYTVRAYVEDSEGNKAAVSKAVK